MVLERLMAHPAFDPFRLVGGTSLSLQMGHRISVDIDLFTDAEYRSLDFRTLQHILREMFPYCEGECGEIVGFGASYIVGNSIEDAVKLDLFYTDPFIRPLRVVDNIRLAALNDLVAMKMEVVGRGGRKKDFWDLHELRGRYSFERMLDLYSERYPYGHTREELLKGLLSFDKADKDPDPNCLRNKAWQLIKMDFMEWLQ